MSSDFLFFAANTAAVLGWLVLGYAVLRRNDWLRDQLAGRWLPLAFAGFYSVLIFFFYGRGPAGLARSETYRRSSPHPGWRSQGGCTTSPSTCSSGR